jgi:hypothetical protein
MEDVPNQQQTGRQEQIQPQQQTDLQQPDELQLAAAQPGNDTLVQGDVGASRERNRVNVTVDINGVDYPVVITNVNKEKLACFVRWYPHLVKHELRDCTILVEIDMPRKLVFTAIHAFLQVLHSGRIYHKDIPATSVLVLTYVAADYGLTREWHNYLLTALRRVQIKIAKKAPIGEVDAIEWEAALAASKLLLGHGELFFCLALDLIVYAPTAISRHGHRVFRPNEGGELTGRLLGQDMLGKAAESRLLCSRNEI